MPLLNIKEVFYFMQDKEEKIKEESIADEDAITMQQQEAATSDDAVLETKTTHEPAFESGLGSIAKSTQKIPFWKRIFLPPARFGQGNSFRITLFIAMMAVMIAMGTVLNMFSFQIAGLGRVSFVYMFMYLSGMLFGPFFGAVVAFTGDGLGWLLRPEGPYMPLIGLSNAAVSMIVGFIFMIRFNRKTLKNVLLVAFVLICMATIMSAYYIGPFAAAQPDRYVRILERTDRVFYRNVYQYVACEHGGEGVYEIIRSIYRNVRVYRRNEHGVYMYEFLSATNASGMHNGVRIAIISLAAALLIFGVYKIISIKIPEGKELELASNQWFAKTIFAAIVAFIPTTLGLSVWGIYLLIQMGMGGFPPTWNSFSIILMAQLVSQPVWVGINLFLMSILVPALNRSVFKQYPLGE